MDLPGDIRAAIEEESLRFGHKTLISAGQAISELYRNTDGNNGRTVTGDENAAAYAVSRMPATYSAVYHALSKTYQSVEKRPESVLDVGAGTGAASLAAINMFGGLNSVLCLEKEQTMLDYGKKLFGQLEINNAGWSRFDICRQVPEKTADLVIASYILNELNDTDLQPVSERLWDAAESILLIVEPGTPEAFKRILKIREILSSKGGFIVAPCPHGNKCPVPENDWCHFSVRLSRSKLQIQTKKGEAPYEDEKFTYIAFSKTKPQPAKARVIRHPLTASKCISLRLCTNAGIQDKFITKSMPQYKLARKVKAGDEFD